MIRVDIPIIPVRAGSILAGFQNPDLAERVALVILEFVEIGKSGGLVIMIGPVAVQLGQLRGGCHAVKRSAVSVILIGVLAGCLQIQLPGRHTAAVCGQYLAGGIDHGQPIVAGGSKAGDIGVILDREAGVGLGGRDLNGLGDVFDHKGGIAAGLTGFHINAFAAHSPAGPENTLRVADRYRGLAAVLRILGHPAHVAIRVDRMGVVPHGDGPGAVGGIERAFRGVCICASCLSRQVIADDIAVSLRRKADVP